MQSVWLRIMIGLLVPASSVISVYTGCFCDCTVRLGNAPTRVAPAPSVPAVPAVQQIAAAPADQQMAESPRTATPIVIQISPLDEQNDPAVDIPGSVPQA